MAKASNTFSRVPTAADPRLQRAFDLAKKCIVIFGITSAIVFGTLVVVASAHGESSTFMWVRATIMLAVTPLLFAFAVRAERGAGSSFRRLRFLSTVLPVAIVVVDLIPGVCSVWYAWMQAVSAVTLLPIAFLTRRREFRAGISRQS